MKRRMAQIGAGISGLVGILVHAPAAMAETRGGAELSLGGSVATNPYNQPSGGSDHASGSVVAGIYPWLEQNGERTDAKISGYAVFDQYLGRYSNNLSLATTAEIRHRTSERTQLFASVNGSSSRTSAQQILLERPPLTIEPPLVISPLPDVLADGDKRSTNLRFAAGVSSQLGQRDSINVSGNYGIGRFGSVGTSDFDSYGGSAQYSRTLSERTSVSAAVSVTRYRYLNSANSGTLITPTVGFSRSLSSTMRLSANAGIGLVRSNRLGVTKSETYFSGDVSLCNSGNRTLFCLTAARATQATAVGTVGVVTAISAAFDRRLSERDRFSLSARYSETGLGSATTGLTNRFVGAAATWDRSIGQRLKFFVSPSVNKSFGGSGSRPINAQLMAGLRYRLGDT